MAMADQMNYSNLQHSNVPVIGQVDNNSLSSVINGPLASCIIVCFIQ